MAFPVIKNSRSAGLARPAEDATGRRDTRKPDTQRSLLLGKAASSTRALLRDS